MLKQCLDIEQAKHLHELGLDTSNAYMCWIVDESMKYKPFISLSSDAIEHVDAITSAIPTFTSQDILDILPKEMTPMPTDRIKFKLCIYDGAIFYCFKDRIDDILVQFRIDENGLIDAAYEMLCWLIENGYIETNEQ